MTSPDLLFPIPTSPAPPLVHARSMLDAMTSRRDTGLADAKEGGYLTGYKDSSEYRLTCHRIAYWEREVTRLETEAAK